MRVPAFFTAWLLTFALVVSAAAMGAALLLDQELRRERAGAAAQAELDTFLGGKLGRLIRGPAAVTALRALAEPVGDSHNASALDAKPAPAVVDLAREVAQFRGAEAGADPQQVFLYRSGDQVTGSASAWPAGLRPMSGGWIGYRSPAGSEVVAAIHRFPNGDELLVGRRVERVDILSGRVLRVSGLTVIGLALAGCAVAGVFSVGYDRRLREITDACAKVESGDMAARAPHAARSDEFGMLAQRVNRMLDRVQRYVEGMRDVSDEIAHDLRTPLNRAQARLSAAWEAEPAGQRPELDMARRDLRDLSKVIDDFLWLREVEIGQGGETAFFDLKALAETVAEDHALIAQSTKAIDLTVTGPPAEVMGVKSLLVRAVDNLIGNAVKFTPEGGEIRVYTRTANGQVSVVVEDTGPGLTPELLARATQPGVRGAGEGAGHGLGLAIAASVARRHGGDLMLANLPRGGLRASLDLPAPRA